MTDRLGETDISMSAAAFRSEPDGFVNDDADDTITGYLHGPRGQYHFAFPASFRWVYAAPTMGLVAIAVNDTGSTPTFRAYYQADDAAFVLKRDARNETHGKEVEATLDDFLNDETHTVLWADDQDGDGDD